MQSRRTGSAWSFVIAASAVAIGVAGVVACRRRLRQREESRLRRAEVARDQTGLLEQHAEELTDLTIRLESSYRELEAFSYTVSHDLRAPLRAINGFATALSEQCEEQLDDQGRHYLKRITVGAARMSQMIDDLLKLSLINRAEVREEDVDVTALATEVGEGLRRAHPDRNVELHVEPHLRVRGDGRLLRIVFDNLLGNAWKFTARQPSARVEVGSQRSDDGRVWYVRDNGVGFDMRYASKLFMPFLRLASARDIPGTGIGLATVERIVRRHGGRVWAEAELDHGATFFVSLRSDSA